MCIRDRLQALQNIRDHYTFCQFQLLPNQMLPLSPIPFLQQLPNSLPALSTRSTCSSAAQQQLLQQQQQAFTFSQAFNQFQNNTNTSNNNNNNNKDNGFQKYEVKVQTLSPVNEQEQFSIESEEKKAGQSQMEVEENEAKIAEKRLISLAQRNIMINFASGLRDFIKFSIQMKKARSCNPNDFMKFENEMIELSKWIQSKQKDFRCFEGWFKFFVFLLFSFLGEKCLKTQNLGYYCIRFLKLFLEGTLLIRISKNQEQMNHIRKNII
eukprot:TRINITY_DN2890_c0_g1_i2.p1 TRINITY_DN2890_c0_g1~~TRINITY_DN2890_c0_g1_i2.p1  ORF type:complete len:267 (-),score=16.63 TRINITY_DN2890_c0_g1_i2:145-945(-)